MRKIIVASAVMLATLSGSLFAFDSDELNKLNITNNTGETISYLFISPGDSADWGPDMLGMDVLSNGDDVSYYMHYPQRTGDFDILAIDSDNQRYEVRAFRLTDGTEGSVTITARNKTQVRAPELINVTLNNKSGYEMTYVFFSPADSSMYGADILGSANTLEDEGDHSFAILKPDDETKYDFWGVDEDNDEYKFQVTIRPSQSNVSVDIELSDLVSE